jgi:diguanylate cyclase (GGDEF)-like protein
MQFDTSTTLLAICCIIAVLGVQSLFFWTREARQAPWLAWFGGAFLCGAASIDLDVVRPDWPPFLLIGVGDALRIACFVALWHSTRRFAGRRPEHLVFILAIAIWLGLCSLPGFIGSLEWRLIVVSLAIGLFCGLSAWELWRNRPEGLPSTTPTIIVYAAFAVIAVLHIPLLGVTPFPVGALPLSASWLAAAGFAVCFLASFAAMLMLSMTRERREAQQHHEALVDPLTTLLNRRAFLDAVKHRELRHKDMSGQLAVLVLDLDHFKAINDGHGHDAGDQVLQHFADVARGATRPADLLHRMGGEEFCFILPGVSSKEAFMIAERIRNRFADSPTEFDGTAIRATVSIGIAATNRNSFDLELLLAAADAAVYDAKTSGRNRTAIADSATIRLEPVRRQAVA